MNQKLEKEPIPFDFFNCINNKDTQELIETNEDAYNSYIANKYYSFFSDCIFFANELNRYSNLSKKQQFDFYYHLILKKKRYSAWIKKQKQQQQQQDNEKIELIVEYYNCSIREAKQMLMIVKTETQEKQQQIFETIQRGVYKGGRK
jgi:hypothetical protein